MFEGPTSIVQRREGGAAGWQDQRGFTLIEMSIVLVIIGLIVGGVLKGQEVVNSARLKAEVAQMNAIKSALYTFQDKFTFLPGDLTGATVLGLAGTSGASDGDENGAIAHAAASIDASSGQDLEGGVAWLQLTAANLMAGVTYAGALSAATTASLVGKLPGSFVVLQTFSEYSQVQPMARLQAVAVSSAISATGSHSLRISDASSLDTKYDDGIPSTGAILAVSAATACFNSTATAYLNGSPQACDLLWVMN